MIWVSFIWSFIRTCWTLIENKSIHRNRSERNSAERSLANERKREYEDPDACENCVNRLKDFCLLQVLKIKYLGIPLIKALPTVIFRLLCFWIILSYCSEFYPDCKGNGPGIGLVFPAIMVIIVMAINYVVGHKLGLKVQENIVNSITNLVIPVYVDLFFLVSIHDYLNSRILNIFRFNTILLVYD